jgi:hypothetical protein
MYFYESLSLSGRFGVRSLVPLQYDLGDFGLQPRFVCQRLGPGVFVDISALSEFAQLTARLCAVTLSAFIFSRELLTRQALHSVPFRVNLSVSALLRETAQVDIPV